MHLMPPSWAAPHELDLPGNKSNTWHTMWNFNLINENLDQGGREWGGGPYHDMSRQIIFMVIKIKNIIASIASQVLPH